MRIKIDPPHPDNIEWKNVGVTKLKRFFFKFLSLFFSVALIVFVFIFLYMAERAGNAIEDLDPNKDCKIEVNLT